MMLPIHRVAVVSTLAVFLSLAVSSLWAATGRVELEVVADARGGAALDFQQWMQALTRAGVKNVRLRTVQPGDEVKIDVRGTADSPVYAVTGLIVGNELVVPGRGSSGARRSSWPIGSTISPSTAHPIAARPARPSG